MKQIFSFLAISLVFLSFTAVVEPVFADNVISLPNPLCPDPNNAQNCINDVPTLIGKIIDYVLTFIGALATLMFVWAGILFVVSGGDEGKVTKARNALMWAAIGLGIALAGKGLLAVIREVIGASPPE